MFSDRLSAVIRNRSAVLVFISLSGLVITNLLESQQENYRAFLTRRVFRLWPAYLIGLFFTAVTLRFQRSALLFSPWHPVRSLERLQIIESSLANFWPMMVSHLFLLHGLVPLRMLPDADLGIMGQAWSLSVEFQFYLIAPFLIWLISRGWWGRGICCLIGLVLFVASHFVFRNSAFIGSYTPWFAIGIITFYCLRSRTPNAKLLLLLMCGSLLLFSAFRKEPGALFWVLVVAMLWRKSLANEILAYRPLKKLGEWSYSTYVLHMLPILLGAYVLIPMHLSRMAYAVLLSIGSIVMTISLSCLCYELVERRLIRLGAKYARQWFGDSGAVRIEQETITAP